MLEGRQIRTDAPYILPKDNQEINRLDFQHFILRNVLRGNYVAPITSPASILDVACGTGRWCEEMAQTFPSARVIGCDLVEQTSASNYFFVQADVLKGLPFPDHSFDFVHQRLLFLALPAAAWPGELRELVRVTRQGGWVELVDSRTDGQNIGPNTTQMTNWIVEVSRRRGVDPSLVPQLGDHLRKAGLANVQSYVVPIPVGHWGGRLGTMMATNLVAAQQAIKPLLVSLLGISAADIDRCLAAQQQEWENMQSSMCFDVVYGQRVI